jgi:hypothetical protein
MDRPTQLYANYLGLLQLDYGYNGQNYRELVPPGG